MNKDKNMQTNSGQQVDTFCLHISVGVVGIIYTIFYRKYTKNVNYLVSKSSTNAKL